MLLFILEIVCLVENRVTNNICCKIFILVNLPLKSFINISYIIILVFKIKKPDSSNPKKK